MSNLEKHLEQISLYAESIATLSFQTKKIFTNALLHTPDITSLIRDTESHERALFSVLSPNESGTTSKAESSAISSRRQTVFKAVRDEFTAPRACVRASRRNTVITTALGTDLKREMKKSEGIINGEVDVEVLLRGIEKLNAVYCVPGVIEQVQDLRNRFVQVSRGIPQYEGKVEKQTNELERMNRGRQTENRERDNFHENDNDNMEIHSEEENIMDSMVTDGDIQMEEREIMELEERRRELLESIDRMDRELGRNPRR
ncbi:hypothetical protein HI914_06231 [Erysiphe necator]|nr:hypothetical protein HI914_06231 [Erysiphe necator]